MNREKFFEIAEEGGYADLGDYEPHQVQRLREMRKLRRDMDSCCRPRVVLDGSWTIGELERMVSALKECRHDGM